MTTTDRLSPITTLTPAERETARRTLERDPALLDGLVLAALGTVEDGEATAARMLATIRGARPCAS